MSDERSPLGPYLFLLSAALIWGASPIIMKLLVAPSGLVSAGQIPPSAVVAIRYVLATVGLAPFAIPIVLRARPSADLRAWLQLIGVGVLGSGVGALLFIYAVKLGSPGIVNALSKSQPIFVVFLSLFLLRERITSLHGILIALMLGASLLIGAGELSVTAPTDAAGQSSGSHANTRLLGDLLALLAGLSWALAVILGKSALQRFPPEFVAFSRLGVGAAVSSIVSFSFIRDFSFHALNPAQWSLLMALGLICGSFALVLYYRGLRQVQAHVAGSLGLVESVITIVLAVAILSEPLNALHVAGISLLLFGAYLIVSRAGQAPAAVFEEGGPALGYGATRVLDRRQPEPERRPLAALLSREVRPEPAVGEPPFGLRLKITSLCVGLIVAIMCVSSSLTIRHTYDLIQRDVRLTMATLSDHIGELSVVPSPPQWRTYRQYLERLVNSEIAGEDYDIQPVFIAVRDENGVVQAFALNSADYELVDPETRELYDARDPAAARRLLEMAEGGELEADIRLSTVRYGRPPRRTVDVGFRQSISQRTINRLATINGAIALGFTLVGLFLSAQLAGHLSKPIETLTEAMERVGAGDLRQEVDIRTSDELAMMGGRFNQMVVGLRERAFLKAALTRYVSVQVAEKMMEEGTWLFTPEEREVTVMFSDIRGFTPLSEKLSPGEVFDLLNEHFGVMVDVIFAHGGTLDKFMGDCIMAVWGSPQVAEDHAIRAVRAGVQMQEMLSEVNAARVAAGKPEIRMGVGINTGRCYAGSLGAVGEEVRRLEYAIIGDDVNLAQRIESQTGPTQVLISQSTYEEVKEYVLAEPLPPISAKGKSEPVVVYRVTGLRSDAAADRQEELSPASSDATASAPREAL
ncbi:MAG: EamA family transporter [Armatimonadota bacterium]